MAAASGSQSLTTTSRSDVVGATSRGSDWRHNGVADSPTDVTTSPALEIATAQNTGVHKVWVNVADVAPTVGSSTPQTRRSAVTCCQLICSPYSNVPPLS
jgi:hypothetical protein